MGIGWSIINISTRLEIFSTRLNHNNINMKLEIFSTRMASQQHQHEAGNLQHEGSTLGITTTSARSWKSSAQVWHQQHQHEAGNLQHEAGNLQHEAGINNINTKLEIFSTRLASTTFCGTLTDPKDLPRNQKDSLGYEILTELPCGTLNRPKGSAQES
jgi:hypothetical protein